MRTKSGFLTQNQQTFTCVGALVMSMTTNFGFSLLLPLSPPLPPLLYYIYIYPFSPLSSSPSLPLSPLHHSTGQALLKKQLIAAGKLGKFGKIIEDTPEEIKKEFALE